jgi:Zn-finger protein
MLRPLKQFTKERIFPPFISAPPVPTTSCSYPLHSPPIPIPMTQPRSPLKSSVHPQHIHIVGDIRNGLLRNVAKERRTIPPNRAVFPRHCNHSVCLCYSIMYYSMAKILGSFISLRPRGNIIQCTLCHLLQYVRPVRILDQSQSEGIAH